MARGLTLLLSILALPMAGCTSFTPKITGSERSGSEQLLMTGVADQAIDCLNFGPLAGAHVFLNDDHVGGNDNDWIIFSLRRAMLRQGVLLVDDDDDAEVIVEAAVAASGTDETDCRVALPSFSLGLVPISAGSTDAISRKNRQDAVIKLGLMATDRKTHHLIWESGTILKTGTLDRRFLSNHEIRRRSSLEVLDTYPRR